MRKIVLLGCFLLAVTALAQDKTSGGTSVYISPSRYGSEFSYDFSTLFTLPADFPKPSRSFSVNVDCPIKDSSRLFPFEAQEDVDIFKKDLNPSILNNGISVAGWTATCTDNKLTLNAGSFAKLAQLLEIQDLSNETVMTILNPGLTFKKNGEQMLLQGGNLTLKDGTITGEPTEGGASIGIKQGSDPLKPVLLELNGTSAKVDFSQPFLIAHSNEGGKLWRNYLLDMPHGTLTLWWSNTVGGMPLPRLP